MYNRSGPLLSFLMTTSPKWLLLRPSHTFPSPPQVDYRITRIRHQEFYTKVLVVVVVVDPGTTVTFKSLGLGCGWLGLRGPYPGVKDVKLFGKSPKTMSDFNVLVILSLILVQGPWSDGPKFRTETMNVSLYPMIGKDPELQRKTVYPYYYQQRCLPTIFPVFSLYTCPGPYTLCDVSRTIYLYNYTRARFLYTQNLL